eukprot:jgi/Chlat1/7507/Chrsp61S07024
MANRVALKTGLVVSLFVAGLLGGWFMSSRSDVTLVPMDGVVLVNKAAGRTQALGVLKQHLSEQEQADSRFNTLRNRFSTQVRRELTEDAAPQFTAPPPPPPPPPEFGSSFFPTEAAMGFNAPPPPPPPPPEQSDQWYNGGGL